MIPDGPVLWFLNRGSGFALLGLLTLTVLLGVLSRDVRAGGPVPGFVLQALHRSTSLLGVAMLAAHVVTAVADEFVDIRWWDAVLPWGAAYQPFWLALGAFSLDLVTAVVVTSLVRSRLGHRSWRATALRGVRRVGRRRRARARHRQRHRGALGGGPVRRQHPGRPRGAPGAARRVERRERSPPSHDRVEARR